MSSGTGASLILIQASGSCRSTGTPAELRSANGRGRRFPHNPSSSPTQPERPSPHEWRYNVGVSEPHDSDEQQNEPEHKHQRHAIYATETAGLLLIAFLLLAITIIHYWHAIHRSLR
jgi:hypothetical protein